MQKPKQELKFSDNKKYKIETISNSKVYDKKATGQLPELYYLLSWKNYPKLENTWEPVSAVLYL